MIISASRRTDIPSYYSEWMFNRLKEGFVYVRNPMNVHQISQITLLPDVVDGIVFWTKNPLPMMKRLDELEKYNYYFQITLTSYESDVEPGLPSKKEVLVPAFIQLSKDIGKEKIIWRYDPIFFNEKYTMEYHCRRFEAMADKLGGYTEKCTVSFLDLYRNTKQNVKSLNIYQENMDQQIELMKRFAEIGKEYGFYIDTCAEKINLENVGIGHAHCIDRERLERIGNYKIQVEKDKNQRLECGCVASIDIGAYNTCRNGCLYCYANYNQGIVKKNSEEHNPDSPLLFGEVGLEDKVNIRKVNSLKIDQMSLFDYINS